MNWINNLKLNIATISGVILLSGCATQETILPPAERQMADI